MKTKKVTMKEFYDKEYDILNFYWGGEKGIEHSRELDIHVIVDFDKKDNVVGIEIWDFMEALKKSQEKIDKIFSMVEKK